MATGGSSSRNNTRNGRKKTMKHLIEEDQYDSGDVEKEKKGAKEDEAKNDHGDDDDNNSASGGSSTSESSKEEEPYWIDDLAGETTALTAALRDAAVQNNVKTLHTLLEFGAVTPHTVERGTGRTACWYAACFGSVECLQILADCAYDLAYNEYVELHAPPRSMSSPGQTSRIDEVDSLSSEHEESEPQNEAADTAANSVVVSLLQQPSLWGSKPLLIAACRNQPEIVQLLLETYGVDVNQTNGEGHGDTTSALIAASEGHAEVINILAKHGADVDRANENGKTPIMIAAENGRVDIMTFLYLYQVNLNNLDENGMNVVALASHNNHPQVIDFLLSIAEVVDADSMSNFNQPSGPMQETPLGIAALKGHLEVTTALLKSPRVDLTSVNSEGMNPLYVATKLNQLDIVKLICQLPESRLTPVANQLDATNGWTALFCAIEWNYLDIVGLLAPRSDLNVLCGKRMGGGRGQGSIMAPVLVRAAAKDNYGVCLTLLKAGAFVDVMDEAGHTALGVAAKRGTIQICDLLCQYGANVHHRARKAGRTPLQKARKYKHTRIVELLDHYYQQSSAATSVPNSAAAAAQTAVAAYQLGTPSIGGTVGTSDPAGPV
jgi:ankyrin repeat protein